MSEWWTYRLSSFLLFSPRTYYRLLELYNIEIWPVHLLALALGAAVMLFARRGGVAAGRGVALILAACWLFVAWAFLLRRYATINWAATYFAAAFVVEALLLIVTALRGRLAFDAKASLGHRAGLGIVVFALVAQPALGPLAGRLWSNAEFFGVAPDPTVAATLGALLSATGRFRWGLAVIPLAWCAVSGAFRAAMHAPDAWVLPLVAVVVTMLAAVRALASRRAPAP
jgi:hypothetical protein